MISDWHGIDRITSPPGVTYSYSVEAGIGAGIDMVWSVNFVLLIYMLKIVERIIHISLHFSVGLTIEGWSSSTDYDTSLVIFYLCIQLMKMQCCLPFLNIV